MPGRGKPAHPYQGSFSHPGRGVAEGTAGSPRPGSADLACMKDHPPGKAREPAVFAFPKPCLDSTGHVLHPRPGTMSRHAQKVPGRTVDVSMSARGADGAEMQLVVIAVLPHVEFNHAPVNAFTNGQVTGQAAQP